MKEEICPLCNRQSQPDPRAHAALALDNAPKEYTVWRCAPCRLRWLWPYPAPEDYQQLYGGDYYAAAVGEVPCYADTQRELAACYREHARHFKALGVTDSLLDVGCGPGDFLAVASEQGIACEGLEPSEYAAGKARERGFEVHRMLLCELASEGRLYRGAHCSHVLEHVPDAHRFMDELKSVLQPGAPLYIEVPLQFDGVLDLLKRLRGHQPIYSDYSIHHHYFFSPRALRSLLEAHGFELMSMTTFVPCRRAMRPAGPRKWLLQSGLWLADRIAGRGDLVSVWARRGR